MYEKMAHHELIHPYGNIYQKASFYWNTRQNDVHVPISYQFAKSLLKYYPEADGNIVLPAILLHDVGWKMVPEEKQLGAFGPKSKDRTTQRLHETEGVRIARKILTDIGYDWQKIEEIAAIIDGHDSRTEAISLNDKLVKDADKLWRFTPEGVHIDHTRFGIPRDEYHTWLKGMIEPWFFTPKAKQMATEEWNASATKKNVD